MFGRHGEAPAVVLAARSPADAFDVAIEAVRLATCYMTPVFVLSDAYIANAAQPWAIPDIGTLPPFPVHLRTEAEGYQPFARDAATLARDWAVPGTKGLEHRLGGLEKDALRGTISYDPDNHQRMTELRAEKIARIADAIPEQRPDAGPAQGRLAVVGWGSTWGPISRAVSLLHERGQTDVAHIHLRHLSPLPRNLGALLAGFERVVVVEMNGGQLLRLLRAEYLLPALGFSKVAGQPLTIEEVEALLLRHLGVQS
jgi:2-oxoglutarate ferredoxin oxidoreductase subunit alpha